MVGDLVEIEDGMPIPADGFLVNGSEVETDESAMTGETDPVKKAPLHQCIDRRN